MTQPNTAGSVLPMTNSTTTTSSFEMLGEGAACTDCLMFLANGETPPEMSETQAAEYLARVEDQGTTEDGRPVYVDVGGSHDPEECPNMVDGEWSGHTDCYCDDLGFRWSSCDVCGSTLAGDRHAVHFFTI